jgi:hypothetical protein
MPPSIVSLQDILKHHGTLAPSRRAFYETLLTHGDVLAVGVNYLPGSLLWLVTTPTQARLMREIHNPDGDLTTVGDAAPATVYEAAAWLLAPPPEERP